MTDLSNSFERRSATPTCDRERRCHTDYTHDEAMTVAPASPRPWCCPHRPKRSPRCCGWPAKHRIPVVARGSGTGLSGGCHPWPTES